ncbi:MAG: hypothetical protein R3F59_22890 [Myxococcota bacterium]
MSDPFDAPLVERDPVVATWGMVLGSWGLAGAAAGTAGGLTAQWLDGSHAVAAALGVGGMLVGAVGGAVAYGVDRSWSSSRPALVDGRRRCVRCTAGCSARRCSSPSRRCCGSSRSRRWGSASPWRPGPSRWSRSS